jgi:hypothetical protein
MRSNAHVACSKLKPFAWDEQHISRSFATSPSSEGFSHRLPYCRVPDIEGDPVFDLSKATTDLSDNNNPVVITYEYDCLDDYGELLELVRSTVAAFEACTYINPNKLVPVGDGGRYWTNGQGGIHSGSKISHVPTSFP